MEQEIPAQDGLTCVLPEQGESDADGPDLSGEDLANVEVLGCVSRRVPTKS